MAHEGNLRIARNTVIVYIRMIVTILVGLITSSLVLRALGATDVGIYSAVGSAVAIVATITGALTVTTVRFMNIELGKPGGDPGRMFNVCRNIHRWGALLLFVLLESVGLWYILCYLNVPAGRTADAMFVFQVSTVVACLNISNVPYQGLFTVHERFGTTALVEIANALVKLLLVVILFLLRGRPDGLRIYAVMMSATTWISFVAYRLLSRRAWPDTVRRRPVREKGAYREVLRFGNWNLLASAALVGRSQGTNMLLNWFFGPAVNAAYFFAGTVQNYVNQFIANFDTAAAPQITQGIAAGDIARAHSLTERVCRGCILLFLLLFVPLWSELGWILTKWLGAGIPEGTVLLCRWTLLVAAASATSAGLAQLIHAYGRIKWYKIEFTLLYLGCLVAGYLLFRAGYPPYTIILSFVVADLVSRVIQLALLRAHFRFPVGQFLREAYLRPLLCAVLLAGYLLLYAHIPLPDSIPVRLAALAASFGISALVLWFLGLKTEERRSIRRTLGEKWNAFRWDHFRRCRIQKSWKRQFGRRIDWEHPRDLNEKIQWLQCFSDTAQWGELADKRAGFRAFVRDRGFGDLLVPQIGSWQRSADIPWDRLPERFVLKCSHDSGSTHLITPETDRTAVSAALDRALARRYGYLHGETFYNRIEPCIVAEEYLDAGPGGLVDYKVWCFGGKPLCIWACRNRTADAVYVNTYDLDWKPIPGADRPTAHYRDGGWSHPRPEHLSDMITAAAALSEGFPEVRVDFYEVHGKLYVGEMTFASLCGRMDFYTDEFLRKMGNLVVLPPKKKQ